MRWLSTFSSFQGFGALGAGTLLLSCAFVVAFSGALLGGCNTVDLGDNFIPPNLLLDEDFFYCRIQPEVISRQTCAGGGAGESGNCHSSRSALRLTTTAEMETVACEDDVPTGPVPSSYIENFNAVQFTVQADPLSSPFYRRPVGLDSHPRQIFPEGSPEADLIRQWITGGSM